VSERSTAPRATTGPSRQRYADLAGITGTGGLCVDTDGAHRLWLDDDLP
jgi:hypothetical protein